MPPRMQIFLLLHPHAGCLLPCNAPRVWVATCEGCSAHTKFFSCALMLVAHFRAMVHARGWMRARVAPRAQVFFLTSSLHKFFFNFLLAGPTPHMHTHACTTALTWGLAGPTLHSNASAVAHVASEGVGPTPFFSSFSA